MKQSKIQNKSPETTNIIKGATKIHIDTSFLCEPVRSQEGERRKMKRLTERDKQENWTLKGVDWQQLHIGQPITKELQQKLYGALFKLMQYENTELSPEQVENLREENEWIPVGTAMPREHDSIFRKFKGTDKWLPAMFEKTSGDVLVTIVFEDGTGKVVEGHTLDGKWKTKLSSMGGTVTAWKPFPESYKEKRNAEERNR